MNNQLIYKLEDAYQSKDITLDQSEQGKQMINDDLLYLWDITDSTKQRIEELLNPNTF
jgi:hypothetical protein